MRSEFSTTGTLGNAIAEHGSNQQKNGRTNRPKAVFCKLLFAFYNFDNVFRRMLTDNPFK